MIQRLWQALRLMIGSGEVIRTDVDRHPATAQIHGVDGEVLEAVPLLSPWGVAARPPRGSRVLTAALGASREQVVALSAAHIATPPPQLAEGEVALYALGGATLVLQADGSVAVRGPLRVEGDVSDARGTMEEIRAIFATHTHQTPTGPTGPPDPPGTSGSVSTAALTGSGAGAGGEDEESGTQNRLSGETGDVWFYDADLGAAALLDGGDPGTVLTAQGRGQRPGFLPVPPNTNAALLTFGVLDGGGP